MLWWPVCFTQTNTKHCVVHVITSLLFSQGIQVIFKIFFFIGSRLPWSLKCASNYQYFLHDYGVLKIQREEVFINCSYYTLLNKGHCPNALNCIFRLQFLFHCNLNHASIYYINTCIRTGSDTRCSYNVRVSWTSHCEIKYCLSFNWVDIKTMAIFVCLL